MTPIELITRKRDGQKLSREELQFLIQGYTAGDIPDYQMAAFLMAVYFAGMDAEETANLVRLMRDSGIVLDLSTIPGPKVDKHSTGGVGDKVSLVLAPLVAACGVINPMISGRSLAHTGGTLDKLEAIPGFNTQLDLKSFEANLRRHGVCLIGQTAEICPADKKLYALRDATATVESIPLICGSILSKKLAEGLDALVLDVKCGNGAIFPDAAYSEKLAHALVQTATEFGLPTVAFLTQMEQPLGRAVGTWVETREAIEMLKGRADQDFAEVTLTLSAYMVYLGGLAESYAEARKRVEQALNSGKAFETFVQIVSAQGGDVSVVEHPERYPEPGQEVVIEASASGFVHRCHARTIGQTAMLLGAGRQKKEDDIDYTAGIIVHKKVGDAVEQGEPLATLYATRKAISTDLIQRVAGAFTIKSERAEPLPVIHGLISTGGRHEWKRRETN